MPVAVDPCGLHRRGFLHRDVIVFREDHEDPGQEIKDAAEPEGLFIPVKVHDQSADHVPEHGPAPVGRGQHPQRKPLFVFRRILDQQRLGCGGGSRAGGRDETQRDQHPYLRHIRHHREKHRGQEGSPQQHRLDSETVGKTAPDRVEDPVCEHAEEIEHRHVEAAFALVDDTEMFLQIQRHERDGRRKPRHHQNL